jgi:hypothetical protein
LHRSSFPNPKGSLPHPDPPLFPKRSEKPSGANRLLGRSPFQLRKKRLDIIWGFVRVVTLESALLEGMLRAPLRFLAFARAPCFQWRS